MSGLYLWAPRLLFTWQLLWLLVHAAPVQFPKLSLDPVLPTSTALEENGPSPTEPEALETTDDSLQERSSGLLQFPPASIEKPSFQHKGRVQHAKNSPLRLGKAKYPVLPHVITPQTPKNIKLLATAEEVTAYFAQFTEVDEPPSQEEVPPKLSETTASSRPTSEADAIALQLTIAPPEHLHLTLSHQEPVQAQQPTWPEMTGRPLDLELTITPEAAVEGEHPTIPQQTTSLPGHPQETLPHPEPVQAQQPIWPEIRGQPLDLELTIKPEAAVEGEHPTSPQKTTSLPGHPQVTLPHLEPVQAQQPTWPEIRGQPLDLELTIKPEAAVEGKHPTSPQKTTSLPGHPQVTLPHLEPVQAQQPTWPEIRGQTLDLELTIKPEAAVEGKHPTSPQKTTSLPGHPQVTLPHPEPVQAQQPIWPEIRGQPLDLELTIKPEAAVEGEHPTSPQKTTSLPGHPQVTLPHLEPVQAQQPTWPEIRGQSLDLELTIKPEAAVEGEHPTIPQQTLSLPGHPQVTLPHPEPVQAQQPIWPEIRGQPLDLELTIKPEAAVEGEHPTSPQKTTSLPGHPQVTLPHLEPVQAQQPTWPEIRGQSLDLELTIKPEAAVEGEHPTIPQQTTAPPEHPQVTLPRPETLSTQYPAWSEISPTFDEQFIRMQHPVSFETGPPTAEQNATMNICELCICDNETLSCTGLGLKQKLQRVPVPQPNTSKGTFTTLNLKGNSISQLDKDTWKSYRETEKLILSDNNLRELRKESFEGLLFLKYLDLSGNNIRFIEEGTFETLPFLEYLNLGGNFLTEVSSGMFRAWHGMQFLHTIILHHNPLTTIEDLSFFKLPELRYLDLGTTQVSLTTVENILTMSTKLEKLILPRHLACCLCQVKNTVETVSHTVRLHCDTECLTKTHCEKEPHFRSEEGSFLKVLQDRKNTSAELMIEPESTPSDQKDDNLSAFLRWRCVPESFENNTGDPLKPEFYYSRNNNKLRKLCFGTDLLMKLVNGQEEAKVSKEEWDVNQGENEKTEAPDEKEEEEEEALGRAKEMPELGYGYRNKVLVATPVIAVATGFTIIFCLILICGRVASKEHEERKPRGFFSSVLGQSQSQHCKTEVGGFWSRLKGLLGISGTVSKRSEPQVLHEDSSENDLFDQMEKGEGSVSTARTGSLLDTTNE